MHLKLSCFFFRFCLGYYVDENGLADRKRLNFLYDLYRKSYLMVKMKTLSAL